MFGFLVVDKSEGITSRRAVDMVKKLVRPAKIGHAGTLDPIATGVLVLCIGPATRLAQYVQQMPKTYVGDFKLGVTSVSDDIESELQAVLSAPTISREQLNGVLGQFIGNISQTPPAFSAVKVDGKRAYKLSRAGQTVALKPKTVTVDKIDVLEFEYPDLKLRIQCGSGTYIRSIGRDVGIALGSGAVMTALNRSAIGSFDLATAISTQNIDANNLNNKLISPLAAFPGCQSKTLDVEQIAKLKNGHVFAASELECDNNCERIIGLDQQDNLLAVFGPHKTGTFKPELNFASFY